jgi:hypothetical protein
MDGQAPGNVWWPTPERFLLLPHLAMRTPSRVVVLSLLVSLISLGLAVYSATSSRAEAPPPRASAPATSLSAARFFVLLPDGRVEITNAWSRRVFRWDGQRWQQSESWTPTLSGSR